MSRILLLSCGFRPLVRFIVAGGVFFCRGGIVAWGSGVSLHIGYPLIHSFVLASGLLGFYERLSRIVFFTRWKGGFMEGVGTIIRRKCADCGPNSVGRLWSR